MWWLKKELAGITLWTLSTLAIQGQEFPTGPYDDESAYLSAALSNTITLSGNDVLGVIRATELIIDDQVDGRCWTNSTGIAARVRAEFEKFGIAVFQEPLAFNGVFSPIFLITAVGYRTQSGVCAVSATASLYYFGRTRLGSLSYNGNIYEFQNSIDLWESQSIFTNSINIDDQLLQQTQEWMDTLVAEIAKARRTEGVQAVLEEWPNTMPMTQVEFEQYLEDLTAE